MKAWGEDHPHVAESLSFLGTLLCNQSDFAGAEPVLRRAVEIQRKLGETQILPVNLMRLAFALRTSGELGEAEKLLREAVRILQETRQSADLQLLSLAAVLSEDGKATEAEGIL